MEPKKVFEEYIHKGDQICFGRNVNKIPELFGSASNKLLFNKTTGEEIGLLKKRLGGIRDTLDGEAWDVCIPAAIDTTKKFAFCAKKAPFMAVKIMPMTLKDYDNPFDIRRRPWRELVILQRTTKEYNKTHIIAFPILYGYSLCDSVKMNDYLNKKIRDRIQRSDPVDKFGKQAIFLYSQLADYDMEFWIKKIFIDVPDKESLMMSVLFQIYFGLHALHVLTDTVHFDLHLGNILVISTDPGGYFHYNLQGTDYYVPNHGLIFKIWDFSRSVILDEEDCRAKRAIRGDEERKRGDEERKRGDEEDDREKRGDEPHLIKQKFVFFGKRNFSRKFDSILPKVSENLLKKSHNQALFSMDTYRFTKSLFAAIRIIQQTTTTTSRQKTPDLQNIEDLLEDILFDASEDIIKQLPKKTPKYHGTPDQIIKTYFKEFKKKPTDAKILRVQKLK